MVIQHNLSAINTYRMLNNTSLNKAKSSEKLSSGYRINRAADDAAGLSISEKMRYQIRGLNQGARNTQDGISFVQVADGAMNEIQSMLQRMNELSVQAANGTNSDSDRLAIDEEMKQIKNEIIRIGNTTKFNELSVFEHGSVQMRLEGAPDDLQIFNETDSDTYGGFVFHEERVPWTDISQNMVKTVDGKQVFVGGNYKYTTPDDKYTFEFRCKDGDTLPLVTREISINADINGIVLGKENFEWDKVYDENGNTVSEGNLHGGPWTVDYYGAKLTFAVPEPVASLESFAADVDSVKNATVYYNWEGVYGETFTEEDALDSLKADVIANTDGNRVNQNSVDKMYDSSKGLRYTVAADDTGVWLKDSAGVDITDSKKTWESFGIENWNDGTKIPDYKDGQENIVYEYHDTNRQGATELKFTFELSDVTDREAVIKSLNNMELWQKPNPTTYMLSVDGTLSSNNVKAIDFGDRILSLNFDEEHTANREFDTKNWEMSDLGAAYNDADTKNFKLTYNANGGSYQLTGALDDIKEVTENAVDDYVDWVAMKKMDVLINYATESEITAANYNQGGKAVEEISATLSSATGEDVQIKYTYDFENKLNDTLIGGKSITQCVTASFEKVSETVEESKLQNGSGLGLRYDYYIKLADDTYKNTKNASADELRNADIYQIEVRYNGSTDSSILEEAIVSEIQKNVGSDIAGATTYNLTAQSYSTMGSLNGTNNESKINRPGYEHELIETPVEPDLWIQHSSEQNHRTGIPRYSMDAFSMGIAFTNVRTQENATAAIDDISYALKYVSEKRSYYGALQNRLEHTLSNVNNISENTTAAESRIRDTDMAAEMVEFSKNNILAQAGQSMLAQANQSTQGVLSLLQ